MFNKFYFGITKTGNVLGGSLKGSLDNISRFLLTEPRIVGLDLFPAASGLPQDGQDGRMARTAGQLSFICFWRACPRQTLLVWQPPHTSITSKCFRTWFSPVSALSLVTPQYGQKATCLCFPLTVRDALLRHTLR